MKKCNKLALLLIILILFFSFGGRNYNAYAATDGITEKLNELRERFPTGSYWNHIRKVSGDDGDTLMNTFNNTYGNSTSTHPCATHSGTAAIGQYDCNGFDGAIQCYGFANKLFYEIFGLYCSKLTKRTDISNITIGDHIRMPNHSAIVIARSGDTLTLAECNWGGNCLIKWGRTVSLEKSGIQWFYHATNWQTVYGEVHGSKMTSGYDRVLPDGNYMISPTGNTSFFLDIEGNAYPAPNGKNVSIYQTTTGDIPDSDAWTITYSNGFYRVSQYGQAVSLDVSGSSTLRGQNVQAWANDNSSTGQKWAISKNGKNGYRLEAQCSGYSLDLKDGVLANKNNVMQWEDNTANAQSWVFIPYKPSQPISNGRYILLYTQNPSYELDVSGDTGSIADGTNVQLWSDTAPSRYNSFDFTRLDNGYYKVTHAASGKSLTVTGGSTAYKANVEVRTDNGSNAQQWAIVSNGAGYSLISKVNGYALDLPDGTTGNQKNIEVYPRLGNNNQRWTFVQAEHTVHFNANGGSGAPADVVKYYKTKLTLPTAEPQRSGYRFLGWSTSSGSAVPAYMPGDEYTADQDMTLYAVWETLEYTLSFNMNGGTGSLNPIHITNGNVCTIPSYVPQRTGYDFLGWSSDRNAAAATYQAGDIYPGGEATLYAVWKIRTYVVSFDSAGAGSISPITASHGSTITLPVPERQGLFFDGWYTGDNKKVTDSTPVVSNLSLTARWAEPSRMTLPANLTTIEDEAFKGTAPNVVVVPDGVRTIGAGAFANNNKLYSVVVYSRTISAASDSFSGCPNLTVYGYRDSMIDYYCDAKGIPFMALDDNSYISDENLPVGAAVTAEKWTYTTSSTETTQSPETSLEGWTKTGAYSWEKTGTGTYDYAGFPSGFDTGSALYKKYNKSQLSSSSTETTKREAGSASFLTYIYWHWTFVDSVNADHASGGHNVYIRNARLLHENVSGSVYRDFTYFDAFETTENQGTVGPTASGTYNIGTEGGYYFWRNNNADASQWWWRFNVYRQTYTDYRKLFTYTRTVNENKESLTPVYEGNGISNVVHLVKYTF